VFESRVVKRIFGARRVEVTEGWRIYTMRSFITYSLGQV
jgi:hypothetical protein